MQNQYSLPADRQDEINLADYVRVILKRWKSIFFIFVLAGAGVFIFSILSPKIYQIDSFLQIGKINSVLIEDPEQLTAKINNQVYNGKYEVGVKAENPVNTQLIRLKIESDDFNKAKAVLEEINNLILQEHQTKTEIQKELIQNDIQQLESKINLVESNIQKTKNKISPIENDIKRIENKIVYAKEEQKNLENKIKALEEVLIYEQDPGTQFALFDTKEKLENKKQEVENLYLSINSLQRTIEDINIGVSSLEAQKDDLELEINKINKSLQEIELTKIVKQPTISKGPIKPRTLFNTAIAGVLGLFIGVFLAFVREWLSAANLKVF
ncbi:MAG: Wzz/FepE/Etk N-terminal domain-containing protein [bacterium]